MYPVLDALKQYSIERAIRIYRNIPRLNMGRFLDVVLCMENGHAVWDYWRNNRLLDAARGALGTSIRNLRLNIKHELDSPLVDVLDAA
jgi:hypothetical protein